MSVGITGQQPDFTSKNSEAPLRAATCGMSAEHGDCAFDSALWRKHFPEPRQLTFLDGVLDNAYCPDCGLCCGPQAESEPFPMALLDRQISERTPDDFHLLDARTVSLDQRGCKSLGERGCRLPRNLRPIACNIFPIVLVKGGLFLYRCCPAALLLPEADWRRMAREVRDFLDKLPGADVRRLAITRRPDTVAAEYVDRRLPVTVSG